MKPLFRILCIALFLVLIDIPRAAKADVAPPQQPPGFNPEPGAEITQVRMMAETVTLSIQASTPKNSLGQAKVSADFTMQNLGTETESMAVRFPLGSNNGFGEIREIQNLVVKVNGSQVVTRRIMQADPVWDNDLVPWAEFDVTFPPSQDVNIVVTYMLEGTGEYPFVSFDYVLHTGAGWKDTIGSADLIVRLPYEVSLHNVLFDEHTGWSTTTPGGAVRGQEIRWHFENLEPDQSHDFEISLVMPSAWQNVMKENALVNTNPNDGEAWGRLGKLYKELFFYRRGFRQDAGGQELYASSVAAYEKCLSILPNDALWHAGFADLLSIHAFYAMEGGQDTRDEMARSMQEIDRAQELAPNDPKVKEIAEKIYYLFPDAIHQLESGYDYLWLTATPEFLVPTPTPPEVTITPLPTTEPPPPTPTTIPVEEATSTPAPEPAGNPVCPPAWILPFGLVWLVGSKKLRRA